MVLFFFLFLTARTIIVVKAGWKQTQMYTFVLLGRVRIIADMAAYSPSLFHYQISHNTQEAFT